jgi:hypothetical protein
MQPILSESLGKIHKGTMVLFLSYLLGLVFTLFARLIIARYGTGGDYGVLAHLAVVVAIDLSTGKEYHSEPFLFLKANHVLGADDVGHPEVFVIVLAVPATVLSSEVIDMVKVVLFKYSLKLPVLADIAADIVRSLRMFQVADPDFMSTAAEFRDEIGTDETQTSGNEDFSHEALLV